MNLINTKITPQSKPVNGGEFKNPNSKVKTSIFYFNDLHGQIPKMQRLYSAVQCAQFRAEETGSDFFKFSSGDTFIGSDEKRNTAAANFLKIADIDAQALGNHEFDITASICANLLKNTDTKILGMNMNFPDNYSEMSKRVMRSTVVTDKSGEKYGVIGVQPSDISKRLKKPEILEGITIDDKDQTIVELQQEVDMLKKQGINKIVLLSHEGNETEREIANKVSGIDVILGGHSHDLIEDVKDGENLFYSPSGEPVVITQAGRDGNYFGLLNLEFNDKGQITYVQNNVTNTNLYSPNLVMTKTMDSIMGVSPQIGTLFYVDAIPRNNLVEENPWADFVADAVKKELDADIVLVNSANFRGSVGLGTVTERDISSIFPFNNKLRKVKINEKDLVDAIKFCAKSLVSKSSKPGIMQVSGLTYTMNLQGELVDMQYIDKQGNIHSVDVNNPDPNKTYTAIYDEFLLSGGDGLDMLKQEPQNIIEKYDFDKDKCTIDYIKKLVQPFNVKKDNRIKIV